MLVRLRFHDETVQVLLTHIARSDEATRRAELHEVIDDYLALPAPAILLGDLNSEAGEPELRRLLAVPDVIDAVGRKLGRPPRRGSTGSSFAACACSMPACATTGPRTIRWPGRKSRPRTKDEGGRRKAESDSSFSLPPSPPLLPLPRVVECRYFLNPFFACHPIFNPIPVALSRDQPLVRAEHRLRLWPR